MIRQKDGSDFTLPCSFAFLTFDPHQPFSVETYDRSSPKTRLALVSDFGSLPASRHRRGTLQKDFRSLPANPLNSPLPYTLDNTTHAGVLSCHFAQNRAEFFYSLALSI